MGAVLSGYARAAERCGFHDAFGVIDEGRLRGLMPEGQVGCVALLLRAPLKAWMIRTHFLLLVCSSRFVDEILPFLTVDAR